MRHDTHLVFILSRLAMVVVLTCTVTAVAVESVRYNVLFIAVDDLRPELGCYGAKHIKTPNIDKLGESGMVFTRAYCQQAVCSPSRTSLMTGLRPDSTRVYDLQTHFRLTIPDVVTLPQYFKRNGYHTEAMGKIYHGGLDDRESWSVEPWRPTAPTWCKPESQKMLTARREELQKAGKLRKDIVLQKDPETGMPLKIRRVGSRALGPSWEDPDVADNKLADGMLADKAVATLSELRDKRFFLAVGFHKPHLPFIAPKKYFDLYPSATIEEPDNPYAPKNVPSIAMTTFGELRQYGDIPLEGPLPAGKARELVHAYYAATSYIDAQVGRVLDELDRLGLSDNTIVVLWGDHGWHLGEHGLWCKHTNFEIATHVPMIVRAPGRSNQGGRTDALVEFVDIYPTLCELAGLAIPKELEGTSMAPLMADPDRAWKQAAFSQYPRGKVMGYSMKTDRYRYTEWLDEERKSVGTELYDHTVDPKENNNIAEDRASAGIVKRLSKQLRAGWKGARPEAQGR